MEIIPVDGFKGGWFIGDFEPAALRTKDFEVSYKEHHAGEYWAPHYHLLGDEINYLISGTMEINGQRLEAPVVFIIRRKEISRPTFITDVKLIVVKVPSVPGDKYEVSDQHS